MAVVFCYYAKITTNNHFLIFYILSYMSKSILSFSCLLLIAASVAACRHTGGELPAPAHQQVWVSPSAKTSGAKTSGAKIKLQHDNATEADKLRNTAERQAHDAKQLLLQQQKPAVPLPDASTKPAIINHISVKSKISAKAKRIGIPRPSAIALTKTGTQPRIVRNRIMVGKPYTIKGKRYAPKMHQQYSKEGLASWYGGKFQGRLTANGEIFDKWGMTAAHKTLQLPAYVKVTNKENGKQVTLRVNDRGPFKPNRIIDLSRAAAEKLDMLGTGVAKVKVDLLTGHAAKIAAAEWDAYQVAERIPFPPAPVNRAAIQQTATKISAKQLVQIALSNAE